MCEGGLTGAPQPPLRSPKHGDFVFRVRKCRNIAALRSSTGKHCAIPAWLGLVAKPKGGEAWGKLEDGGENMERPVDHCSVAGCWRELFGGVEGDQGARVVGRW
jgi:hypothetical protein